jgi:hypothetical protein
LGWGTLPGGRCTAPLFAAAPDANSSTPPRQPAKGRNRDDAAVEAWFRQACDAPPPSGARGLAAAARGAKAQRPANLRLADGDFLDGEAAAVDMAAYGGLAFDWDAVALLRVVAALCPRGAPYAVGGSKSKGWHFCAPSSTLLQILAAAGADRADGDSNLARASRKLRRMRDAIAAADPASVVELQVLNIYLPGQGKGAWGRRRQRSVVMLRRESVVARGCSNMKTTLWRRRFSTPSRQATSPPPTTHHPSPMPRRRPQARAV